MTTSQASPFQKFGNPEIKTKETSPASPFQKIGNAETRTDKICEPQGNDSLCGSLLSGEREKTGLRTLFFFGLRPVEEMDAVSPVGGLRLLMSNSMTSNLQA